MTKVYQAFFDCKTCGHAYNTINTEKNRSRGCVKCGALNAPIREVSIKFRNILIL